MTDYAKLVKALRCCAENFGCPIECPRYSPADEGVRACVSRLEKDAAAAIEELQSILTEADKKQAYQHDCICELTAENEELKADVKQLEPKRGEWIHGKELSRAYVGNLCVGIVYENFRCSACDVVVEECEKPKWKFCPNCGAKMEVQE